MLDDVEELLLRNRKKSYAIAARSIVRSGTGHKYWSGFNDDARTEIERLSAELNVLFLKPELKEKFNTLDLPMGGSTSPVEALKTLVEIISMSDGNSDAGKALAAISDDTDGMETIAALKRCLKVGNRLTGNDHSSLGLHPAVFFYTERGKHSRFLFLGTLKTISKHIRDNNKTWFVKFTKARSEIERLLISQKVNINQGLANVSSNQRIDRVSDLLDGLVEKFHTEGNVSSDDIYPLLKIKGNPSTIQPIEYPRDFSSEVKSAIFLKQALASALKCLICGGLLNPALSASYDHIVAKNNGGLGAVENGQITHPFCNTGMKGSA